MFIRRDLDTSKNLNSKCVSSKNVGNDKKARNFFFRFFLKNITRDSVPKSKGKRFTGKINFGHYCTP